ncbi:MAG: FAD-dependent monooxygenase [Rickettsiales bacterium]
MFDADIAIVGGGVNGLLLAYNLSLLDNNVVLIDSLNIKERIKKRIDGRGIALSKSSEKFLRKVDLWNEIFRKSGEIKKICVSDYNSRPQLKFDCSDIGEERLGIIAEMDDIQQAVYNKVINSRLINVCDNEDVVSVDENGTQVVIRTKKNCFSAKLLIACDGKNSFIRSHLNIKEFSYDYNQIAAVFNIQHQKEHHNVAYELFYPNGPLAILPRNASNESSVVWVERNCAENTEYFNNSNCLEELSRRIAKSHGDVNLLTRVNYYPLHLKCSKKYYSRKTIFIGDSLHHIHPVAGQGFNLSIKDIQCLCELITEYKSYGLLLNDGKLFREFFKKRVVSNISMISITHGLERVFSNNNFFFRKTRGIGLGVINKIASVKNIMMKYAIGR